MRRCLPLLLALAPCPAVAQVVNAESFTNWAHVGGAPSWTDDLPDSTAIHGRVDRLHDIADLSYTGNPLQLSAGTYVMSCRVKKLMDGNGAADLTLSVIGAVQGAPQLVLSVAEQTVDAWVWTPALVFDVPVSGAVVPRLENRDIRVTKRNYDFDAVVIGAVDVGKVVLYENLGRRWGHAWGAPYYAAEQPDPDSALGYVELLSQVWWLEWGWPWRQVILQPGAYTANARIKKVNSTAGAQWIDVKVDVGGNQVGVRLEVADQPLGVYAYTPNLSFEVTQPNTPVQLQIANTESTLKQGYHFDAFLIRRGQFRPYGQSCPSSLGPLQLSGSPPLLGAVMQVQAVNVPTVAVFAIGGQALNIDLTPVGMTSCRWLATTDVLAPVAASGGVAALSLPVPAVNFLRGRSVYLQAFCPDQGINPLGVVSSNGGEARVSPQ